MVLTEEKALEKAFTQRGYMRTLANGFGITGKRYDAYPNQLKRQWKAGKLSRDLALKVLEASGFKMVKQAEFEERP